MKILTNTILTAAILPLAIPAVAATITTQIRIPDSPYTLASTESGDGLWCNGCGGKQGWGHIDSDEMMTLGAGTSVAASGGKFAILHTDMGMSCPAGNISVLNLETGKYVGPEIDECNDELVDYKVSNGKWWIKVRNHMYSGK
ncbi:hypothetical protein NFK10_20060 [Citrobacter braakii]|uniref:hypothetical protein n=1 Tax=Citrobacter braakii TaxID=57706 RepID=UPI0024335D0F|nr:hypothetical protein [Citrobacter braakii]WFX66900.1 hypothetical protein NFK10_20060 [Citrobacter braakii]